MNSLVVLLISAVAIVLGYGVYAKSIDKKVICPDCQKATPLLRTGYQLEQTSDEPNGDRLAAFQEYMSQCGVLSVPLAQTTANAPLLIPLNGDDG